jgi:hypothetical protein
MSERSPERDADLFSPSLRQSARRDLPAGSRPWRLRSQFYVAFFGGPLAAAAIGFLNGRRLGLSRERLWAIAGIGIVAFVAVLALAGLVLAADTSVNRGPRLMLTVAGVVSFLAAHELQKDADRLYGLNRDEEQTYDSLWGPGLGTVLLAGIFSVAVVAAVA